MKRLFVLAAVLILTGLGLAACENTVKGLGQDMERSGQQLQK